MVEFWLKLVIKKKKTLEQVPEKWRNAVEEALKQGDEL